MIVRNTIATDPKGMVDVLCCHQVTQPLQSFTLYTRAKVGNMVSTVRHRIFAALTGSVLLVFAAETAGDQLRFDRAAQWNEWWIWRIWY